MRLDRLAVGVPFKDKSNIARRGHAQDLRCRGDTWFIPYPTVRSKAQKFSHPGTFPLDLPRWCIRLHGKPGAVVLDPFMGTGTTLVAAGLEGASGIGIELDPAYVATARARLAQRRSSRRRMAAHVRRRMPRVALFVTCLVDLHRPDGRLRRDQAAGAGGLPGRGAAGADLLRPARLQQRRPGDRARDLRARRARCVRRLRLRRRALRLLRRHAARITCRICSTTTRTCAPEPTRLARGRTSWSAS